MEKQRVIADERAGCLYVPGLQDPLIIRPGIATYCVPEWLTSRRAKFTDRYWPRAKE
jgi:hypothetical protein